MAIDLMRRGSNSLLERREEGLTFAVLVRQYRKVQGLTQEELAEEWSYSFETISSWEREKRFPARPEISRLAHLLEIDVEELTEMIIRGRSGQMRTGERGRKLPVPMVPVSMAEVPFEHGRLFWMLHLGVEHGRLQCLITCPLASGEVWEVPLDSLADGEAIRHLHQMVHEHVSNKASGQTMSTNG